MNEAFGPGAWVLIPMDSFIRSGNTVVQSYALYINGNFVAQAYGEHALYGDDQLGTALEATKSSALVRCCKDLGVASELWDSKFTEAWKAKNAVAVWVENQVKKGLKKKLYRKKDDSPFGFPYKETSFADSSKSEKSVEATSSAKDVTYGLPSDMALPSLQDMPALDSPQSEDVEAPEELVQSMDETAEQEESVSEPKPKPAFKKYTNTYQPKEQVKQPAPAQSENKDAFMFDYLAKGSFLDLKSTVGMGKFKEVTWGEFIKNKAGKGYAEWALQQQNLKPDLKKKFETALKMITKNK